MDSDQLPKTVFSFIFHFIKKQWPWFLLIQIFAFAWTLDYTVWPILIGKLVDSITHYAGDRTQAWGVIGPILVLGAILWLTIEWMFRGAGFLLAKVSPRFEAQIRSSVFDYVQRHSQNYINDRFAGTLANKVSDISLSAGRVVRQLMFLFLPVVLAFLITSSVFFRLNPWLALILLGWITVHLSIAFYYSRQCAQFSNDHAEARSALSGLIVDALTNHAAVRLFSRHFFESKYFQSYQIQEAEKNTNTLWHIEKMKMMMGAACFLGAGVAMNLTMVYFWVHNLITTGDLIIVFYTTNNMTTMTWLVSVELPNLFNEIGVCQQALSVIRDPHDIKDIPGAPALVVPRGEISFDDVTFSYEQGKKLFHNKSITIRAGEKVGLVGFSGAGKSTFVQLIMRSFDLEEGRIIIDGQDISTVSQDSLRNQIAYIPQDPSLFHRSLMDNIRYGKLDATDEEVIEASKKANCDEFIQTMPKKYATLVGERGIKLSGGQRQRIAIARAILKNAPVLILDEATSALDSITEKSIQKSLHSLMKGRTAIVIAHRLSTIAEMDRILVFEEGKVVEEGTHGELLAEQGHYARLWSMQSGGFLPNENKFSNSH